MSDEPASRRDLRGIQNRLFRFGVADMDVECLAVFGRRVVSLGCLQLSEACIRAERLYRLWSTSTKLPKPVSIHVYHEQRRIGHLDAQGVFHARRGMDFSRAAALFFATTTEELPPNLDAVRLRNLLPELCVQLVDLPPADLSPEYRAEFYGRRWVEILRRHLTPDDDAPPPSVSRVAHVLWRAAGKRLLGIDLPVPQDTLSLSL